MRLDRYFKTVICVSFQLSALNVYALSEIRVSEVISLEEAIDNGAIVEIKDGLLLVYRFNMDKFFCMSS